MEYIIIGIVVLIMGACFVAPLVFDSMSKEEREAAGLVWRDNNN
jgi:hypothetical protein